MSDAKHTPTPWTIGESHESMASIYSEATKKTVFKCSPELGWPPFFYDDVKFAVLACNCHDELVKACEDSLGRMDRDAGGSDVDDLVNLLAKAKGQQ